MTDNGNIINNSVRKFKCQFKFMALCPLSSQMIYHCQVVKCAVFQVNTLSECCKYIRTVMCMMFGDGLSVKSEHLELVTSQMKKHSSVSAAEMLLLVEFTTLSDYLHYLQGTAQALAVCGNSALIYLAAAVSDFYIPTSLMASNSCCLHFVLAVLAQLCILIIT